MNIYQNIKNNNKIYLIFGGFGAQPNHFTPFFPDNLIIVYHYQHLNFTPLEDILTLLISEQIEIEIYAFSMGVWVANLFLQNYNSPIFIKKTAINGTEFGIDDIYGIPLKVFKLTQKMFNLEHFKANLLGRHSTQSLNLLDEKSLKEELGFFISNHKAFQKGSIWDKVIISKQDLIFPTTTQELFWGGFKGYQEQILRLDSPHFVFFDWAVL
ncbi:pimeloyl-ACP methyl esterase BioG family protein [Helicobacter mesocricetorum]|uniref:pimeloyl-ACP methyl esterase BioG family protein n=1 Tax=Helicobacter mesocricetorum TaxID=87012 RepID=UPI000CF173F9|nr:pimeloyl-ACP methyl esterase BioG family protein [Helicobacter mesocricetorum]